MRQFRFSWAVCTLFLVLSSHSLAENLLNEPIQPLPLKFKNLEPEKVALGYQLFEDKRLSHNQTISCSSCHNLSTSGADGLQRSVGIHGALGEINAPTVFNSGFNSKQFWNGRAKNLEDQIDGPLQHAKEMGAKWSDVVARIRADSKYQTLFNKIYKDGVTQENIKNAIATFEQSLVTSNSRFDQYLLGNKEAITEFEKMGYQKFKSFGCVACHQGMNIGGNMFQTMGVMGNYFKDRAAPMTNADLGRYNVTKNEDDKHVFRVPSLRNIALTSPYFHDGSVKTLEEAIGVMGKYQLGRKISEEDRTAIAAFLKTLTGEKPQIMKELQK